MAHQPEMEMKALIDPMKDEAEWKNYGAGSCLPPVC